MRSTANVDATFRSPLLLNSPSNPFQDDQRFEIFANVQNLFDERYATFGLFSDPTGVGAPGVPPNADSNAPGVDNRFQSPGMPRSYFGGVRISFN
jgi:iron complex outermembrane recepter protein